MRSAMFQLIHFIWLQILILSAVILASGQDAPDDFVRLPPTVAPSKYYLDLSVPVDFMTSAVFSGKVVIEFAINETSGTNLKLHCKNLVITENSVHLSNDNYPLNNLFTRLEYNTSEEIVKLYSDHFFVPGNYTLQLDYAGKLANDMTGFYISSYVDQEGTNKTIATTQFEPTYARKAFPCFDEPNYKATFQISITHPKNGYFALSNTPKKKEPRNVDLTSVKVEFFETPPMSTYLVAFVISGFASLTITDEYDFGVYARKEAISSVNYAISVAPKIIAELENFTGVLYGSSGMTTLNMVAIPDFSAGAMENWGLVTFRETALLWDPVDSTDAYKQRVLTVVAHEFAHMWFGDLVTLDWWQFTWMNEGFARFFQYFISAKVETTWEIADQFLIEQKQSIFIGDSLESSPALNSEAGNNAQINSKFSSISYNKGASVIRMLEDFIGPENFKRGINLYLNVCRFNNVVPDNLWSALQDSIIGQVIPTGRDVATIMRTWTEQAGYPVITISLSGADVIITQQRFLFNKTSTSNLRWDIPISFTTSLEKQFSIPRKITWFLSDQTSITISNIIQGGSGWIIANLQGIGYYRVNYDDTLWTKLILGLQNPNFDGIDVQTRTQIVDDALNLARASLIPYSTALDVTLYLQTEIRYYPWYAAFNNLAFVRRRFNGESDVAKLLTEHLKFTMQTLYANVTFTVDPKESHVDTLKKVLTLSWACELGFADCITTADEFFTSYKHGTPVPVNLRSVVYCTALKHSANSADDWNFLWGKFGTARVASDQITIMNALGCTQNETLLEEYLLKSIDPESGIRSQDAQTAFTAVCNGNPNGVGVAFQFLKKYYKQMAQYYGGLNALTGCITTLADKFTTSAEVADFEEFVTANANDLNEAVVAAKSAIENAKANVDWVAAHTAELTTWLQRYKSSAAAISVNIALILGVISIILV